MNWVIAAIAMGSNVGDRASHLEFARHRLESVLTDVRVSSFVETEPVGVTSAQPLFLNAAAVGATMRSAEEVFASLLAIEAERGRERPYPRAPRTLDLDLILYGDRRINTAGLVVPHPRFRERAFVLGPLAEIAPDLRDPLTGKTIRELLAAIRPAMPAGGARRP
jgi:2-amino-4-hydroxy-6-hydroxymethyldihydropteridine diphosphokinase